jgi:hypothetical protein
MQNPSHFAPIQRKLSAMIERDRELDRHAQVQQESRVRQRELIARSKFVPQTMREQLVHEILPLLLNACIATAVTACTASILYVSLVLM